MTVLYDNVIFIPCSDIHCTDYSKVTIIINFNSIDFNLNSQFAGIYLIKLNSKIIKFKNKK